MLSTPISNNKRVCNLTSLGYKKYLLPQNSCVWFNLWVKLMNAAILYWNYLSVRNQNVLHVQFFQSCLYSIPLKIVCLFVYCLFIWLRCIAGICINGMNFKFHIVICALFVWDHFELQMFFTCPKITATRK